jgi:hypothetical protein
MARDLQPFDSTEFVLNAAQGGVGHPPGQPLYALFAAAFVHALPLSPPTALSLLSVLSTVGCVWLALHLGRASMVGAVAAVAALLLPGVWDLATRPEVYATAAAFSLGAVAMHPQKGRGPAFATGLWLGAAASVNPIIGVQAGLVVLCASGARLPFLAVVGGGLCGLAPYLLLPVVGAHPREALVWGAPLSGQALVHFLAGRDYRGWHLGLGEFAGNLGLAARWLMVRGLLPLLLLGTIGEARAKVPLGRRMAIPLATAIGVLFIATNHPFIDTNPDYDGYLWLPAWLAVAGAARLADERRWLAVAAPLAIAAAGVLSGPPLGARVRGATSVTRALAVEALREAPDGAVLLVESDHLVFPLFYLTEVERQRSDVVVLNVGWASSSWFWQHLVARDSHLATAVDTALMRTPPPGWPPREARMATFLEAAARPVVGESLRLASLAKGRPCLGRLYARAAPLCLAALPGDGPAWLAAQTAPPESLDERLIAATGLSRADDAWRTGDAGLAWRWLHAALPARLRDQVLAERPSRPAPPFHPAASPARALAGAEDLLQRFADLAP